MQTRQSQDTTAAGAPGAGAQTLVIERDALWLFVALSVYWAWSFTLPRAGLTDSAANLDWTLNAACHAVAVLVLGAPSLRPARSHGHGRTATLITFALGMSAGALLTALSGTLESTALAYVGSALAGLSAGVAALTTFPLLARFADSHRHLFVLVSTSIVTSSLVSLVILVLPVGFQSALLALLPLLMALCLSRMDRLPSSGAPAADSSASATGQKTRLRDAVSIPLLACSFLFAFSASLFKTTAAQVSPTDLPSLCALTFLTATAVLVAVYAGGRARLLPPLVFIFMPVLAGGVLLIPFLVPENALLVGVLIDTARNLFAVYLYSSLALIVAARGRGVFATGMVVGVGDIGHAVASLTGAALTGATSGMQGLVPFILLAYLVFTCSILLLYPTRVNRETLWAEPPAGPDSLDAASTAGSKPQNETAPSPIDLAAQTAGLSERERELLPLLLGAKTMAGIADELGISYNTAKTHASHIFRKAGVGSREELVTWVEGFGAGR